MGNGFGGIDGAKIRRYDADKPRPHGPGPAARRRSCNTDPARRSLLALHHRPGTLLCQMTKTTSTLLCNPPNLKKPLDSGTTECYDADIPNGTTECHTERHLDNLHGHRPGKNTGGVS